MQKAIFLQLSLVLFSSSILCESNYKNIWEIHEHSYVTLPNRSDEHDKQSNQPTLPILNEKEKAYTAFDMLSQAEINGNFNSEQIIQESCWEDFNFYFGSKNYPAKHILNSIDRTKTKLGYACLANQLTQLTSSIKELHRRQAIFKQFLHDSELAQQVDMNLEQFSKLESDFEVFYSAYHDHLDSEISRLYFNNRLLFSENALDVLNSNKYALTAGHIGGSIIQPIWTISYLAIMIPHLLTGENLNKTKNSISNFLNIKKHIQDDFNRLYKEGIIKGTTSIWKSGFDESRDLAYNITMPVAMVWGCIVSISNLKQNYKDFKLMKLYLNSIINALNSSRELYEIISKNAFLSSNLKSMQSVKDVLNDVEIKYIFSLKTKTIYNPVEYIYAYRLLNSIKEKLLPLVQLTAEVDMYRSISILLQENLDKKNQFCIPKYIESNLPYVEFENLWNPILNVNKAVANNVKLGSAVNNQKGYSITLTGPNESGKSNFQKSILISILMSQSLGISASQELSLRPFQEIKYYRNSGDNIIEGKSLYRVQAEQFTKLFNIDSNKVTYLALDEPTTGANAEICATVVLCSAQTLKNKLPCVCVLSTHYPLITELERLTDGFFKNYKFSIIKDEYGNINYPYILQEGISDQHIELDILKREGLDEGILRQVEELLRK